MSVENPSNNVMIDPSLILAKNSIGNTFESIRVLNKMYPKLRFYYPMSLTRVLDSTRYDKDSLKFSYFMHNAYPADLEEIESLIKRHSDIFTGFEMGNQEYKKHSEIFKYLKEDLFYLEEQFREPTVTIIFEEWVFLQEKSWVVSRIKKPFNRFIAAGAVCLQFGNRVVDKMIRKSIKKNDDDLLDTVDKLRAFGKWIAVGGPAVVGILSNPVISVAAPLVAGFFLLFDPNDGV
jgi:hypothetical protein